MGVASHLKIDLARYDEIIRTFIPWYEEMLDAAAGALEYVKTRAPAVIDLGIGTGALAKRCLRTCPRARLVGIDGDPEILAAAGRRLRAERPRLSLVAGDFELIELGRADAIVASLSLHHVKTRRRKGALYTRAASALNRGGVLVTADCAPASDPQTAALQHAAWRTHMRRTYGPRKTARFFRAWARDDVYMPMAVEMDLLREAGLKPEVLWRRGPFAVIAAFR